MKIKSILILTAAIAFSASPADAGLGSFKKSVQKAAKQARDEVDRVSGRANAEVDRGTERLDDFVDREVKPWLQDRKDFCESWVNRLILTSEEQAALKVMVGRYMPGASIPEEDRAVIITIRSQVDNEAYDEFLDSLRNLRIDPEMQAGASSVAAAVTADDEVVATTTTTSVSAENGLDDVE